MREEPERIFRVNQIAEKMRAGFHSLGFDIGHSVTPVIPIIIGDDERTFLFWRALFDEGVFVQSGYQPGCSPRTTIIAHQLYGYAYG